MQLTAKLGARIAGTTTRQGISRPALTQRTLLCRSAAPVTTVVGTEVESYGAHAELVPSSFVGVRRALRRCCVRFVRASKAKSMSQTIGPALGVDHPCSLTSTPSLLTNKHAGPPPRAAAAVAAAAASPPARDDLDALLEVLPASLAARLASHPRRHELIEVVLDLGRKPEARFQCGGFEYLADEIVRAVFLCGGEGRRCCWRRHAD